MERYIIVERYADNGELSHRALVDSTDGRELGTDPIKPWTHYAAQTLLAEHRRAVRVVKQEIEAVKNDQRTYRSEERCLILGSLETVLKALQRGRG